jgi:hypothetical protein
MTPSYFDIGRGQPAACLNRVRQFFRLIAVTACAFVPNALAQAPAAGPLALLLPASPRATALGNAWGVAGRDDYSVFYNPAQIFPTNGIGASFTRYEWNATLGAFSSAVAVGPVNYAWGVEVVDFKAPAGASYPFVPADLTTTGTRNASSLVAATGASFLFKNFRAGVGLKYAEDRVDGSPGSAVPAPISNGVLLGDFGVSHSLLSGTAAVSVENIGHDRSLSVPLQTALAWTRQMQAGDFDLAFAAQISERNEWLGAGGGIEAGYGWIDGWSVAMRAGAHRTETAAQRPVSLGGSINADRLVLDYALEFFEGNRYAHHLSIRWR